MYMIYVLIRVYKQRSLELGNECCTYVHKVGVYVTFCVNSSLVWILLYSISVILDLPICHCAKRGNATNTLLSLP